MRKNGIYDQIGSRIGGHWGKVYSIQVGMTVDWDNKVSQDL
jgi:hypothetical protein